MPLFDFPMIDDIRDAVMAMCDAVDGMKSRIDSHLARRLDDYLGLDRADDHRVTGGVLIPPTAGQIRNGLGLKFDGARK